MNEIYNKILEKLVEEGDSDEIEYFKEDFSERVSGGQKEIIPFLLKRHYFKYFNQDELDLISQLLFYNEILSEDVQKSSVLLSDLIRAGIQSAKVELINILKNVISKEDPRILYSILNKNCLESFSLEEVNALFSGLNIEKIISLNFSFVIDIMIKLLESGFTRILPYIKSQITNEIEYITYSDLRYMIHKKYFTYFDDSEQNLMFKNLNLARIIPSNDGENWTKVLSKECHLLLLFSRENLPNGAKTLEEWLSKKVKLIGFNELVSEIVDLIHSYDPIEEIEYIGAIIHLLILNFEFDLSRIILEKTDNPKDILDLFSRGEYYGDFEGIKKTVIDIFFQNFKRILTLEFRSKNVQISDLLKYACIEYFSEEDLSKILIKNQVISEIFFNEIPKSIDNLGDLKQYLNSLKFLNLQDKSSWKVPYWVRNLSSIEHLVFSHNNIDRLPNWIGELSNLKKLEVDINGLSSLPDSIGELTSLETLNLRENSIYKLPSSFRNLGSLKKLNLGVNNLTKVPEQLKELRSLEKLILSLNRIQEIPLWVLGLPRLKYISLYDNPIGKAKIEKIVDKGLIIETDFRASLNLEYERYNYKIMGKGFAKIGLYSLKDLEDKAHYNPKLLINQFFSLSQFSLNNLIYDIPSKIELELQDFYELLKFASDRHPYVKREIRRSFFDLFDYSTFNVFFLLIRYDFSQFLDSIDYELLCKSPNSSFLENILEILHHTELSSIKEIKTYIDKFIEDNFTLSSKKLFQQKLDEFSSTYIETPVKFNKALLQEAIIGRFKLFKQKTIYYLLQNKFMQYLTKEQKKSVLEAWMKHDIENVFVILIGGELLSQFGMQYRSNIIERFNTYIDWREKSQLSTDLNGLLEELELPNREIFSQILLNEDRFILKEIFDLRQYPVPDETTKSGINYTHLGVLREVFDFLQHLSTKKKKYDLAIKRQVINLFTYPSLANMFSLLRYKFYKLLPLQEFNYLMKQPNSPFLKNIFNYLGHKEIMGYFDASLIPCDLIYLYFDEETQTIFSEKVSQLSSDQKSSVIDGLTKMAGHKTYKEQIFRLLSNIKNRIKFDLKQGGFLRVIYYRQEEMRNTLQNPNEKVIDEEEIVLNLSFPGDKRPTSIHKQQGGFTRIDLFRIIHEKYEQIYKDHFDLKKEIHIWSIYIQDLYINGVFYDGESKEVRIYMKNTAKAYQAR